MWASTLQVLDVWCLLEEALAGVSTYGGHTAEIYVYLLQQHRPSLQNQPEEPENNQIAERAHADFYKICELFEQKRNCKVHTEFGYPRFHATVTPN